MTLHRRLLLLHAIKGRNIRDTNDQVVEPAAVHHLYPAASAAVDARTVELYKLIDDLRADRDGWREQAQYLARRARRWSRTNTT
jgi:hypothetical protein